MDGFNMLSIKLAQCRNCFSIAQNEHYVAALGDQIVVYSMLDWTVKSIITSKMFPHPYGLQFLSEHIFIVKNNYAQYMVYDILKNTVLWKFKPRGYDSIDVTPIVSSEGTIYDILTHCKGTACCSELIIYPNIQQYEIRDLAETSVNVEGWPGKGAGCSTIGFYSGNNKMYLLKGYVLSPAVRRQYTVEYVLFQRNKDDHSSWGSVKRWRFHNPINFKVNLNGKLIIRDERKRPIFFDEQYIVWNDLICEHWQTGVSFCLEYQDRLDTPAYMERRFDSKFNLDFWLVHRGNTIQIRQYKSWSSVAQLSKLENCLDIRICDIAILRNSGKILIGTYSGLFLCDLQLNTTELVQ